MKGYWDQLRPLEKRMVVGIGSVLFIVLNLWFVVPHFSDWNKVQNRMVEARRKLAMYQKEIDQMPRNEAEVKRLEGEGLAVPAEDQSIHFSGAVQTEAVRTGVSLNSIGKITSQTGPFFVEQSQTIGVVAKEQALVDFLYNLGSGSSLIRVRDLSIRPEPQHHDLSATIKLVASYQKKTPIRGTAPAAQKSTTPKTPSPAQNPPVSSPRTVKPGTANPTVLPGGKPIPSNNKKT